MECPPTNVQSWYESNKEQFAPPICNKLMHKNQLSVMFVGGPNTRTDFHVEMGSEFFYMVKGDMELPTIQCGKRKLVKITEGQVFLLPSRVPHSPQRPQEGSLGLVVERQREEGEMDNLRWYTDFEKCDQVLWERFFRCDDLGKDLKPVVEAFKASEECKTGKVQETSETTEVSPAPFELNSSIIVPDPFDLQAFVEKHRGALEKGETVNLFEGHPDGEFNVLLVGGPSELHDIKQPLGMETMFYQLEGEIEITVGEDTTTLGAGSCCVVGADKVFSVKRHEGSVGMMITQDPSGNKSPGEGSLPPAKVPKTDQD